MRPALRSSIVHDLIFAVRVGIMIKLSYIMQASGMRKNVCCGALVVCGVYSMASESSRCLVVPPCSCGIVTTDHLTALNADGAAALFSSILGVATFDKLSLTNPCNALFHDLISPILPARLNSGTNQGYRGQFALRILTLAVVRQTVSKSRLFAPA